MLSEYCLPTNLSSSVLKEITEGAAVRVSRCKNIEDLFLMRAFRVLDSYFVWEPVLPPLNRWRLINRRTRFARGLRRPRSGIYLRIPVVRTFQFVIRNICARICALCDFEVVMSLSWLLGHINHSLVSFGCKPHPLSKPTALRKFYDPLFPSFFPFSSGEIISCPSRTLISRRRTTLLLDRCRVSWKRLWKRDLVERSRCFLSSRHPKITFDILSISRNVQRN